MTEPQTQFVDISDARLAYVDWGDNGPPLLLLHGDLRTGRSFDGVARDLYENFHVVSLDARGHGDSDWTPRGYRFDERVEDLKAFCDALSLTDIIGAGHSTGGVVMVLAADKYPGLFSRLALMEPMVIVDEPFQRMVTKRIDFDRTTWKSREEVFEYLSKHHSAGRWRADVIRDVAAHESYQREDGLFDMKWSPNSFNWPDRDEDYFDLKPIFDRLGIPILSISSTNHKSKFPNQHMVQDGVLGLHKLTIENSDHNMYMERPDAIAQAVADFAAGKEIPAAV
jgi:pimeloyl-ACP methyl ester carboxylesterase